MPSTPALLDDIFQQAVSSFEATLTDKQRHEFQNCTRKHVEDTILGIQNRLASQRKQRSMEKISKFVEGMTQLGKVIEIFVNCDSTVAFVWAPIKFVLLVSRTSKVSRFNNLPLTINSDKGCGYLGRDIGLPSRYLCRNRRVSSRLITIRKLPQKPPRHWRSYTELLLRCAGFPRESTPGVFETQ